MMQGTKKGKNEIHWVTVNAAGIPRSVQKISSDLSSHQVYHPLQIRVDAAGTCYIAWYSKEGNNSEVE